jgi:D-Tyr-tRNAtyr deacylase
MVYIVAVGIRKEGGSKDIYNLAKKLIRLRLFNPDE